MKTFVRRGTCNGTKFAYKTTRNSSAGNQLETGNNKDEEFDCGTSLEDADQVILIYRNISAQRMRHFRLLHVCKNISFMIVEG